MSLDFQLITAELVRVHRDAKDREHLEVRAFDKWNVSTTFTIPVLELEKLHRQLVELAEEREAPTDHMGHELPEELW